VLFGKESNPTRKEVIQMASKVDTSASNHEKSDNQIVERFSIRGMIYTISAATRMELVAKKLELIESFN
jgi:hypothetical protein